MDKTEITRLIIYLAGLLGLFAGAVKIDENIKLKKEIKDLKRRLGRE